MSDYPKVSQTLSHPVGDNLRKLADLFPSAVKDGELDIDALREELGEFRELQPGDERYELSWAGKQAAKKKAFEPLLGRTLKFFPEESKDPDTTGNLFIEGDNLEALKLLRQNYYGQVKMIYIDPPYNTGNDFVYKDKFSTSRRESDEAEGAVSEAGERLFKNETSSNRFHANWLNMMYPRLRLAKDLLREDGVIFISIDDNEVSSLQKICDELFSQENFITTIMRKRKKEISSDSKNVAVQGEYIVTYARSDNTELLSQSLSEDYVAKSYKEPTSDFPDGKWRPVPITVSKGLSGGGYEYSVISPGGKKHDRLWAYPKEGYERLKKANRLYFGSDGNGIPQRVIYAHESKGQPATNYWDNSATNKEGKKEILNIFGDNYFDTAKPTAMIRQLICLASRENGTRLGRVIEDFHGWILREKVLKI